LESLFLKGLARAAAEKNSKQTNFFRYLLVFEELKEEGQKVTTAHCAFGIKI
jgi:hypothetical protein